ncbi:MAG: cell division protein FtsL [Rhodoferax sp.]|nr:cell division protein FtsL [Rhodoferax sp.]
MDAFVRNKCETELLAVFQEVCMTLGTSFRIESVPFEDGGLREYWKVYGENSVQINTTLTILAILISAVSTVLSRIPIADLEKDAREKTIQELTIEEKRLALEEKRLILEQLRKEMKAGQPSQESIESAAKAGEQNLKIQSRRSNFYKNLRAYEKVTDVGFSVLDSYNQEVTPERLVPRVDFTKYILIDNNLPTETADGAIIEIVAPVLKEGNYKWKGIYDGEPISFSMTDAEFKNSVLQEKVAFQHGSCINCVLQVHRKFNEIGEVEVTGYSVITVIEKTDGGTTIETSQGKKHRAYKKFTQDQQGLF